MAIIFVVAGRLDRLVELREDESKSQKNCKEEKGEEPTKNV